MGTTIVTMDVSSADSLVVSLTSELVRPLDLLETISSIALNHSSVAGSENSRVFDFIVRLRGVVEAVDGMGREC